MKSKLILLSLGIFTISSVIISIPQKADAQLSAVRSIVFPVIGKVTYYDDFGNSRDGGARTHEGNDLFAPKMTPLVSAVDGTIVSVNYPEASWGMAVTIRDSDGFTYHYIHMNNDTPGTDDGKGDGIHAYSVDIAPGNKVVKGQLIGFLGDSGNAETTPPHLHFEIRQPDRQPFSPFQSLQNATKLTAPVVDYPKLSNEFLPYEQFGGGAHVASAKNLDGDSGVEYVTGAGPGGGPLVKVLDDDGDVKVSFYAYDANFRGGVDVAVADIDDDGKSEIITAPGPGGGPHIRIFEANGKPYAGTKAKDFFAYDPGFSGGVYITAADMDHDDIAEIVTGAGPGGGPHVKVFKPDGTVLHQLFPYDMNFRGGVDVGAFPATSSRSSGAGGFVTAPGTGGGPHVKVYNNKAEIAKEFFAYEGNFNLGLRVSAGNASSDHSGMEIAVIPATGGGPHAKLFSKSGSQVFSGVIGFEPWWRGGYDVALHDGGGAITSFGGRRTSLRKSTFRSSSFTDRDRWRDND